MDDKFQICREKFKLFIEQHARNVRYWNEHSIQLEKCKERIQKCINSKPIKNIAQGCRDLLKTLNVKYPLTQKENVKCYLEAGNNVLMFFF